MPKAIRTDSDNNRTTGLALPGRTNARPDNARPDNARPDNAQPASVAQQVHDGDTLNVIPKGNIAVRLLGIDTPEVSFAFPAPRLTFRRLNDSRWNDFLTTALDARWGEFATPLTADLQSWLRPKLAGQPGTVHYQHAEAATDGLRNMITQDMQVMGQDLTTFGYYLSFGFEVMDGYGRFLCLINRDQPQQTVPTPRPLTYNMRLLQSGRAFPYLIWPNINPWDRPDSVVNAVILPGQARQLATSDRELQMTRDAVRKAREKHLGVFDAIEPCLLEPFELRFLSRREWPSRHVIDLTSDSDHMLPGHRYFEVPHPEDRLWIPAEYVPLFQQRGWKVV